MSESSFSDSDLTAGSTVDGEGETAESATADREAAFDDPTSPAAGNVTGEDAVVAVPPADSTVNETADPDRDTSHTADVEAGYDDPSDAPRSGRDPS